MLIVDIGDDMRRVRYANGPVCGEVIVRADVARELVEFGEVSDLGWAQLFLAGVKRPDGQVVAVQYAVA